MPSPTKRTHYYHADANALGGVITRPVNEVIAVQSPLSLSPSGGFAATRSDSFQLHEIISADTTRAQVSGSRHVETGNATTMSTAVVENLNVLHILTADRIVSQISTEHPSQGHDPRVTFYGSRIENLQIAGHPVEVILDLDIFGHGATSEFPGGPPVADSKFLQKVGQQFNQQRGFILCSLVKEIRGEFPGTREGNNVLVIPDFGKVYLAELLVDATTHRLIMMRLELGSPTEGAVSFASAAVEGRGFP